MNERTFSHLQAHRLDAPERQIWLPTATVLEELDITSGMIVADIGAGTGHFALPLASAVGVHGKVFAIDLQPEMLALLQAKLPDADLVNVECRTGEATATGLEANCCDLVLLANIWHELDHVPQVLAEVKRILRSSGRVAILDWRPGVMQPPGPPLAHRIPAQSAAQSLASAGFNVVKNIEIGMYSYLVLADVD